MLTIGFNAKHQHLMSMRAISDGFSPTGVATARASFAFYNTREEVDKLADAVQKVIDVFA